MRKINFNMNRDKWILLVAAGLLLLVVFVPSKRIVVPSAGRTASDSLVQGSVEASVQPGKTYEERLEDRVREILKNVDGVGKVDVMIVLKSSEEKVLRVDKKTSSTSTDEQDSGGGSRVVTGSDLEESTILLGSGDSQSPIVEKELKPEIAGIIISATGGGSPTVKAEISDAMEALFNVPPHKIRVLKRVE